MVTPPLTGFPRAARATEEESMSFELVGALQLAGRPLLHF